MNARGAQRRGNPARGGRAGTGAWLPALLLGGTMLAQDIPVEGPRAESSAAPAIVGQASGLETESPDLPTEVNCGTASAETKTGGNDSATGEIPQQGTALDVKTTAPDSRPESVEWLGQTWVLRRHQGGAGADTDEYYTEGEGPEDWSQVLAVQRARAGTPATLAARLGNQTGVHCRILREDKDSCVLSLVEQGDEEKEGVMLVQKQPPAEGTLVVISYLQRPSRLEASRAALQLGAWRERLLAQAHRRPAREAGNAPAQP